MNITNLQAVTSPSVICYKKKGKIVTTAKNHTINVYKRTEVKLHASLTSLLDGGE